MIFCPQCGVQNPDGARFCDQCGAALIAVNRSIPDGAAQPPAAVAPPPAAAPLPAAAPPPTAAPTVAAPFSNTCPQCGTAVIPGEAFCDNCGAALIGPPPAASAAPLPPSYAAVPPQPSYPPPVGPGAAQQQPSYTPPSYTPSAPPAAPRRTALAPASLVVVGSNAVLPLPDAQQATIGRSDPASQWFPEIDLTAHGALDKGVGRKHARLFVRDGGVLLEDLDSTNGTVVGGRKLAPRQPQAIAPGEVFQIGALQLRLEVA